MEQMQMLVSMWIVCGVLHYFIIRKHFRRAFYDHEEPWSTEDAIAWSIRGVLGPIALFATLATCWWFRSRKPEADDDKNRQDS